MELDTSNHRQTNHIFCQSVQDDVKCVISAPQQSLSLCLRLFVCLPGVGCWPAAVQNPAFKLHNAFGKPPLRSSRCQTCRGRDCKYFCGHMYACAQTRKGLLTFPSNTVGFKVYLTTTRTYTCTQFMYAIWTSNQLLPVSLQLFKDVKHLFIALSKWYCHITQP